MTDNYDAPSIDSELEEIISSLDDEKICMEIANDEWGAVCHPDIEESLDGAPFGFETVGSPPEREEVGEQFKEEFNERVTEVWEKIDESDDPLETIMDIGPEDLSP